MDGQADLVKQILAAVWEQLSPILSWLSFLWGLFAGLLVGLLVKIIYDKLAEPHLEMAQTSSEPFRLEGCELDPKVLRQAKGPTLTADVLAYRVKVTNRQKCLLNAPARNCIAWLEIDGTPESYQLCWVGSKEAVTINVGDSREIDVCGLVYRWGRIIAPTESGYHFPTPRTLGGAGIALQGQLRVTSENAKFANRRIIIDVDANHTALKISLE